MLNIIHSKITIKTNENKIKSKYGDGKITLPTQNNAFLMFLRSVINFFDANIKKCEYLRLQENKLKY